jgi:GTP cyclohydrolase III
MIRSGFKMQSTFTFLITLAKGVKAGMLNKILNKIRNVFALRQVSLRVTYKMPRPQREV